MRALIRLLVHAVAAMCLALLIQGVAQADTVCQQTNRYTGQCIVWVKVTEPTPAPTTSADDGPKDTGSGHSCYWDPSKQHLSGPRAGSVPCTKRGFGYWSNTYNCYIQALKPQPAAGDPMWQGHDPADGAVYSCYQPQTDIAIYVFAANPPRGAAAGPSPREVAQIAIRQMKLSAIDIGIAPEPGPNSVGLVGMPVWLWVKNPRASTYGPATASASAGGITVRATARVRQITWDMGDGTRVVCSNAGTAYQPKFGRKASPTCGHSYAKSSAHQREGKYTVTATSDWVITWTGAGQTGVIRLGGLTRSVQIAVGEAQVLVE